MVLDQPLAKRQRRFLADAAANDDCQQFRISQALAPLASSFS